MSLIISIVITIHSIDQNFQVSVKNKLFTKVKTRPQCQEAAIEVNNIWVTVRVDLSYHTYRGQTSDTAKLEPWQANLLEIVTN